MTYLLVPNERIYGTMEMLRQTTDGSLRKYEHAWRHMEMKAQ